MSTLLFQPRSDVEGRSYHPETTLEIADAGLLDLLCTDECEPEGRADPLRFTLPPVEMRLPGFKTREEIIRNRFPTPLDGRGLVDIDTLIESVKSTVHPSYRWPGYCDEHHTLWPAYRYWYVQAFMPSTEAVTFRNLAVNKIWVPRVFHNWIHVVTEPPEVPPTEIMRESIEEWSVICDFFNSVRDTVGKMRLYERERVRRRAAGTPLDEAQERSISEDLQRRLGGVVLHCRGLMEMDLNRWTISTEMGLPAAAGQIGDLVIRGWQRRTKDVRRIPEMKGRVLRFPLPQKLGAAA